MTGMCGSHSELGRSSAARARALALAGTLALAACGGAGRGRAPAPVPGAHTGAPVTRLDTLALAALDSAGARYLRAAQRLDPAIGFPRSIQSGSRWTTTEASEWTSGFFAGTLWSLYEQTGSAALRAQAERWTAPLPAIFRTPVSHDLGFQFFITNAKAYRLTGEERYRATALEAARLLAGRFNEKIGATRSWNGMGASRPFPVIADNMMNLELLFWGARHGGRAEWADMARRHAATTLANHVRPDGGSFHVVSFDTATGRALERFTVQGYADSSTWSRGEAWLLYGFTMAARETPASARLRSAARLIADYFVAHLPADGAPCWDFQAPGCPGGPGLRDASAAAIAASGLLELSTRVPGAAGAAYRAAAERTLTTLVSPLYFAPAGSEALLLHATGHRPAGSEVDVSIVYADYYFVEALMRYLELRGLRPRTLLVAAN
jgi:unsaturated chondroitin disaccharide hydrolase